MSEHPSDSPQAVLPSGSVPRISQPLPPLPPVEAQTSTAAPQPDYKAMRAHLVTKRTLQYTLGGFALGAIIGPEGTAYILDLIASGVESPDVLFVLGKIRDSVENAVELAEIEDRTAYEYAQNLLTRSVVPGAPVGFIGAGVGRLVGKATQLK